MTWVPNVCNWSKCFYLPRSEVADTTCLLGSNLPPLLWRRMLPRDHPRPGFVGEEERSSGACSGCEESFWWTCQRSPEFDHLEPLLENIIDDTLCWQAPTLTTDWQLCKYNDKNVITANKWEVYKFISYNNFASHKRHKTEWEVVTSACVGCEVWSWKLLQIHSWNHSMMEAVGKKVA